MTIIALKWFKNACRAIQKLLKSWTLGEGPLCANMTLSMQNTVQEVLSEPSIKLYD